MKSLFDNISHQCSKQVTRTYSTSFSTATKMLSSSIRQDIYNIYGFVRLADEIVDSFQNYPQEELFANFEKDLKYALNHKISLNPILNSFQETVHKYNIEREYIETFMTSMKMDLSKSVYESYEELNEYIYGSADVVGLMCLKVFVKGDQKLFTTLKGPAMALGSAFQKVNFLRDLKADYEGLNRVYFPDIDLKKLNEVNKTGIIREIESDFQYGYTGIRRLPKEAKLGVYLAYKYYRSLLKKLKKTPSMEIMNARIRIPNHKKIRLLAGSYIKYKLNLIA